MGDQGRMPGVAATRRSALVIVERNRAARAQAGTGIETGTVIVIVFLHAGRALDLQKSIRAARPRTDRGGTGDRLIQSKEISFAIVPGVEGAVFEASVTVLALNLNERVVA